MMNTMSIYNNVIEYGEIPDAEYYIANGDSLKWNGEDETFTIVVKEKTNDEDTYDNFSHVTVDGVLVSVDNYTVTKGSAKIAFKKDYIKTLASCNHTAKIFFRNGAVENSFTNAGSKPSAGTGVITKPGRAGNPGIPGAAKKDPVYRGATKTGESSNSFADIMVLLLSGSAIAGISVYRRKRA
ncbi:hypothetical protein [Mogibacterium pumilum]|uniref:Gram-positive cocci surface proteins LPxTG domain-containing protein n=1 Tax=Mogibacterium pumilum TaxID=86332 RepID=A0A223AQV4_9FIRM|nr:hypothetical protein [Mogibacterium pumilum]ASS37309.1 hypothetical protein AXF17_01705 [Mogibacterium pumilum]